MALVGPWLGGRRGGADIWDLFDFGGSRRRGDRGDDTSALALVNVDWCETEKAHVFRVDLPGVKKEKVQVQVEEGNVLQISGEWTKEEEDANDKWHRVERRHGSFVRRFRLPDNVKLDEIKCGLENGVLMVTVPKEEVEQTPGKVRQIDVA